MRGLGLCRKHSPTESFVTFERIQRPSCPVPTVLKPFVVVPAKSFTRIVSKTLLRSCLPIARMAFGQAHLTYVWQAILQTTPDQLRLFVRLNLRCFSNHYDFNPARLVASLRSPSSYTVFE